jgi:hypothetical protein
MPPFPFPGNSVIYRPKHPDAVFYGHGTEGATVFQNPMSAI